MAKTQTEALKNYLMRGNEITPIDALQLFGCMRLASRISEFKLKDCIPIESDRVNFLSRYGYPGHYNKYWINKEWLEKQVKPVGRPNVVKEKKPELFNEV